MSKSLAGRVEDPFVKLVSEERSVFELLRSSGVLGRTVLWLTVAFPTAWE